LVIADPATRDLEAIVDHISLDNPDAAEGIYWGIVEAARKLPQFPALGRPSRYPETRELSVSGLPYLTGTIHEAVVSHRIGMTSPILV
jgi:toxin ParE1/3/4